jgi:hypothetical protein
MDAADLVLADHDLLNELAVPQVHQVRAVERAGDFTAGNERQPLHTLKVRVLDGHDAFLRQ